jgi:hypothetical protein
LNDDQITRYADDNERIFPSLINYNFDNMIMHKLNNVDTEISQKSRLSLQDIARALGLNSKARHAPMYSMTEPTWFDRFTNWLRGKQASTAKIQQSSMRVPPMSPMRKQVQARYAALKQQAAAQQPNLKQQKQIESRMYEHPAIPTPESSYILPH